MDFFFPDTGPIIFIIFSFLILILNNEILIMVQQQPCLCEDLAYCIEII